MKLEKKVIFFKSTRLTHQTCNINLWERDNHKLRKQNTVNYEV